MALVLLAAAPVARAAGPVHTAAVVELHVASGGSDVGSCTSGSPCLTLQRAVTVAAGRAGDDVTIDVGSGSFDGASIDGGSEHSLRIVGVGIGITTLNVVPMTSGFGSLDGGVLVQNTPARISVEQLTITAPAPTAGGTNGSGVDATGVGNPGNAAPTRAGIFSAADGPLEVIDVQVTGIVGGKGGTGAAGTPSGGTGGGGGNVLGIVHAGTTTLASTVLRGVHIEGLVGGPGGDGGSGPTQGLPGQGGGVGGIQQIPQDTITGMLVITKSAASGSIIDGLTAGASGAGAPQFQGIAFGGFAEGVRDRVAAAYLSDTTITNVKGGSGGISSGIGVAGGSATGVSSDSALTLDRVDVENITGGAGSAAKDGTTGNIGGTGGDAIGVQTSPGSNGSPLDVHATTIAHITAGDGGPGGSGIPAGSVGGQGGTAGSSFGIAATDLPATVADSTITDVQGGTGGTGGTGTGAGAGGTGGDAGPGIDNLDTAGMIAAGSEATLRHVTITATAAGTPGTGGSPLGSPGGGDQAAGVFAAGSGSAVTLQASLLDNVASDVQNCFHNLGGTFADGAGNAISDGSCPIIPQPAIGSGLGTLTADPPYTPTIPLANNADGLALSSFVTTSTGLCDGAGQNGVIRPGLGAPDHCAAGAYEPPPTTGGTTNLPPVAAFTATPPGGAPPLDVTFNVAGSHDPDSGDHIATYTWDFGDGTTGTGATPPPHHY
ncbi:MAG TPA: PKD domain-containing protein, partial [Sporichthyaceae bacterium]|nr:PKD domain-containing protein [Sporichthyaceae bacterium]